MATINVGQRQLSNYLKALEADETEIEAAGEGYLAAKARLDVALRRYTALREFVAETLGRSPYSADVEWPGSVRGAGRRRGNYRFADLGVGDAIIEVFLERFGEPIDLGILTALDSEALEEATMTLDEITEVLLAGGLGFPEVKSARAVNAALIRTGGMTRFEGPGGQVRYALTKRAVPDVDDLPFE